MAGQISRIRNRVLLLVGATALASLAFLVIVIPIVSDMTPEAARSAWLNFAVLGPFVLIGTILAVRWYLRPISDLGYALEMGSTPNVELTGNARRIALNAPVYLFVIPTCAVLLFSLLVVAGSTLLWPRYVFAEHLWAALLTTVIAACGALFVSLVCRRLMRPVLLYTSTRLDSGGIRISVQTRLLVATVTLLLLALLFPGVFGVMRVVHAYRLQVADATLLHLTTAIAALPPGEPQDQTLDHVVTLLDSEVQYDHLFLLDDEGTVLDARSRVDAPLGFDKQHWLPERPDRLRRAAGSFVIAPIPGSFPQHWVGTQYAVHPMYSTDVIRTAVVLSATGVLALALAVVVSHFLATDIVINLRDVASQLLDVAHGERVDLGTPLPVLTLDEVGDLVTAYNALQERVRLQQEQIEHKQRQLMALQSLSYKIGTIRNVEHLLREVIRDVERAFGYHNVSILLADQEQDELYFAATDLADPALLQQRFKIGEDGVVGRVAATGAPMLIDDVSTCDFYISDKTNTRSELAVPMVYGDQVIGVFNVSSERTCAFEESDLRIVTALSNQVAVSLENVRLLDTVMSNAQELEDRTQNLTILHYISTVLSTALRQKDVLKTITEQLTYLFDVGHCAVLLFGEEDEYGQISAEHPDTGLVDQQVRLKGFPVIQRLLTNPKPLLIADVQRSDQLAPLQEELEALDVRSVLVAPLASKGRVEGLILLNAIGSQRSFTLGELDICQTIAAQVAVSVENVRLIESLSLQAGALARMARDVTAERGRLDAVLRSLVDGLLVTDAEGRIVLFNPAFCHMFGLSEEGLRGQVVTDVVPELPLHPLINVISQVGAAQTQEMTLPDGRFLDVSAAGVSQNQDPRAVVMVLRDVTRERQLEEMKNLFISTASHELRTPLTPVLGFAKLIQKSFNRYIQPVLPPGEQAVERVAARINQNLDIMIGEVDRLRELLDDVFFLADLDAGQLKWHMQTTNLSKVLENIVLEHRAEADSKGLTIHTDWPDQLHVHGDAARLGRAAGNLVSNAVKFTQEGEIRVSARQIDEQDRERPSLPNVTVPRLLPAGSYALVTVSDTGPGISPEAKQSLFERFGQGTADVLTEKAAGTGLGLALSKEIIGHHGGQIWAESSQGQGSTFAFALPLAAEGDELSLWGEAVSLPDTAPTILVVDDEPAVRELLYYVLLRAGYRTLMAVDGPTALNMARFHRPDLIVLDIMIPGISGLDVASVLKSDETMSDIPIIILSILADEEKAAQLGAEACFSKPFDQDTFVAKIAELVAQRRSTRATG